MSARGSNPTAPDSDHLSMLTHLTDFPRRLPSCDNNTCDIYSDDTGWKVVSLTQPWAMYVLVCGTDRLALDPICVNLEEILRTCSMDDSPTRGETVRMPV